MTNPTRAALLNIWNMGWDAHEAFMKVCPDQSRADAWAEGYARGVRDQAGEMEPADNPYGPTLATADDVIEGRAKYADTSGGHADRATRRRENNQACHCTDLSRGIHYSSCPERKAATS